MILLLLSQPSELMHNYNVSFALSLLFLQNNCLIICLFLLFIIISVIMMYLKPSFYSFLSTKNMGLIGHVILDLINFSVMCILSFYHTHLWKYSIILFSSINIFLIIMTSVSLYLKLYAKRHLSYSMKSFFWFLLNYIQMFIYIWSCYLICFSAKTPIYKENLSLFSQYRYLLFSIIVISIILYFLITIFKSSKQAFISKISYPYLKEEIRVILYTWNATIFSPLCSKLIDKIYSSKKLLYFYFCSHFIIFYVSRIIVICFFINFVWFHGDLRKILYTAPFFFIIWLLSFFDYYFQVFFKNHCNYIRSVLSVKQINPVPAISGMIYTSLNNINFNLTSHGFQEGFTLEDMPVLINEWEIAAYLAIYFEKYAQFLVYLNRLLFFIQMINIFALVYFFLLKRFLR